MTKRKATIIDDDSLETMNELAKMHQQAVRNLLLLKWENRQKQRLRDMKRDNEEDETSEHDDEEGGSTTSSLDDDSTATEVSDSSCDSVSEQSDDGSNDL